MCCCGCLKKLMRNLIWMKTKQVEYLRLAVEEKVLIMKLKEMKDATKRVKKEDVEEGKKEEKEEEMKQLEDKK